MPGMELTSAFDPRIDQLSKKIQEIRNRKSTGMDDTMDGAMNVVEQNLGRKEARQAEMSLIGLSDEMATQQAASHSLDPMKVADLISDPFDD